MNIIKLPDRNEYQMPNYRDSTWQQGDLARFHASDYAVEIFPCLFFYSGFGQGRYFAKDGNIHDVTGTEAHGLAKADGVEFVYKDSFAMYTPTFVGN